MAYKKNAITTAGGTFTGDIIVPNEAYGSSWNANFEAPTKTDVYAKIESVVNIPYTQTSFTVPTGTGRLQIKRLTLASTDRATIEGTARLQII
jgi:hypothetical protein